MIVFEKKRQKTMIFRKSAIFWRVQTDGRTDGRTDGKTDRA